MANGSIEALITVPTGGWTVSVNDGGGADVATVAAGTYFPTELRAAFKAALDSATGKTFTIAGSYGSSGTGIMTSLSISSGTYTLAWTSTQLRDVLGFTADLTPTAASFAGTNGMKGLFLPDCPFMGEDISHTTDGHQIDDERESMGPTGTQTVFVSNSYRAHFNVKMMLSKNWAVDGASSTRISWQQFVRESLKSGLPQFPITAAGVRPTVRIYHDKDASVLFGLSTGNAIYRISVAKGIGMKQVSPGWDGLWEVTIPKLVKT